MLLQEAIDALYVRADSFVFRMNPGDTQPIDFYASRFGQAAAIARFRLHQRGREHWRTTEGRKEGAHDG